MKLTAKIAVLQLTPDHFRLIVVKTGSKTPKVLEKIDEVLPPPNEDPDLALEETAAFIKSHIKKLKHQPTIFLLNAPHAWSVMRLLSVPFKGAKKVRAAITFELEPYLAIPIEDLLIDHNKVAEVDGSTEVFVMGLQQKHVEEQTAILSAAGITIEGIGLDIVGLSALYLDTQISDASPQAIILNHDGNTYFTVVYNRALAYVQRINAAHEQSDAFTQEIQNAIRAFHANSITAITLTQLHYTDSDLAPETRATLLDRLELPIEVAALGESWAPQDILDAEDASTWLSMIGTATAAAGSSLSLSFSQTQSTSQPTANPYKLHLLALAALIFFTLTTHLFITHTKTRSNLQQAEQIGQLVWQEFAATYPNNPAAKERPADDAGGARSYEAMLQALEQEQSSTANLTPEMFNQPSLMNILKEIAQHMPDNLVSIDEINITNRRNNLEIRIRGNTKNSSAFGNVVEGLSKSPILELKKQDRTSISGKETFEITANIISEDS